MELDEATVQRARRGDRAAPNAFLRRYDGPLPALLRRSCVPNPEDAVQELLAKLLVVLPRFDPAGTAILTTWVFTVAHRWLLDQRKRRHLCLVPLDDAAEVADPLPGADRLLERKEMIAALELAISRLPDDRLRTVLSVHIHTQPTAALS